MKLLIYAPSAREGGGITYLQNLLSRFPRHGEMSGYVIAPADLEFDETHEHLRRVTTPSLDNLGTRAVWEKIALPRLIRKLGIDTLFCPGGTVPYFDPAIRTAVTFQNMLPFDLEQRRRFPLGFMRTKWALLRHSLAKGIKRSDLVIFISKYGEKVIRDLRLCDFGKSVQIYHGVDKMFGETQACEPPHRLPATGYILYVSAFDCYKSHLELLRGYAVARQRGALKTPLVLVGQDRGTQRAKVEREIERLGLRDSVIVQNEVARTELPAIYRSAEFCVYPSECENCPFIVLEMLASGCPIASSSRSPMPEIAGDAAVYFNPRDVDDIASVLERLNSDHDLREALSKQARERALGFDWNECAERTWTAIGDLNRSETVSNPRNTDQASLEVREVESDQGWRKALRYAQIYGLSRTWTKIRGRRRKLANKSRSASVGDTSFIGCGQFAYSTIGYFLQKRRGDCFLDCFDVDDLRASSLAREYGCRVTNTATELIQNPHLQYLYIASNHATHTEYAVEAIRRGVPNVFIEKPIAVEREQLAQLIAAVDQGSTRVFAGYNRPYAKAIRILRDRVSVIQQPWSIACHVTGHEIKAEHWYRDPNEGTRICGNLGHWIDLAVHVLAWRSIPGRFEISLISSNREEPDDNLTINLVSDLNDLVTITLTSRCEPFEGINETVNLNHYQAIAKIDDFRTLQLRQGEKLIRRRFWPKDVGHRDSVLQPILPNVRDWNEVVLSSLLTLSIKDMMNEGCSSATFDVKHEMKSLTDMISGRTMDGSSTDKMKDLRTP